MSVAVVSAIVCSSVTPRVTGIVVWSIIPSIVVARRVVPPDRVIIPYPDPNAIAVDGTGPIEPGIIVRRVVIAEPVGMPGIPIILVGILAAASSRIVVLLVAIGLLVLAVPFFFHSTQLGIAPGEPERGRKQKERDRFSY
jgi:hypothetical protein